MNIACRIESEVLFPEWTGLDVLNPPHSGDVLLTTERAESCYGLPVVVRDRIAYGPADLGAHVLYVRDQVSADAARRAGYTVELIDDDTEPPNSDCTDMGGWLTY